MYWLAEDRSLTRAVLKRAAHERGLNPKVRARRAELLAIVRAHDAARCIQRALRQVLAARREACPITLQPLPLGDARFTFRAPGGREVGYCAQALADYILSTGDTRDPVTRLPYSSDDIARLERATDLEIAGHEAPTHSHSDDDDDAFIIDDVGIETTMGTDVAAQVLVADLTRVFDQGGDVQRGEYLVLHFAPMLHMLADIARDGGEEAIAVFSETVNTGADTVARGAAETEATLLRAIVAVGLHSAR